MNYALEIDVKSTLKNCVLTSIKSQHLLIESLINCVCKQAEWETVALYTFVQFI